MPDYTPTEADLAHYHARARPCVCCEHWARLDAELQGLERMLTRPVWWRRLWRALFVVALLLVPTGVGAIPACYHMAPNPKEPWIADATPIDCGGKVALVLDGIGGFEGSYLEIPESRLWIGRRAGAEEVSPVDMWFWFGLLGGPRVLIDPDLYDTQWLFGSTWYPPAARWWHEHVGVPEWGPYVPPDEPLTHSPEPTPLALLLTTASLIGWRGWRAK